MLSYHWTNIIPSSVIYFLGKKNKLKPNSLFSEQRSILIVLKIWVCGLKYREAVCLTTESPTRTGKLSPGNLTFWPKE